jgi:deoxycytidine triphosphate deaminase
MTPEELAARIDGLLHAETQVGDRGVDLTAGELYEVAGPGRIDFGGGELDPAALEPHPQVWRNEDDDYRWWHPDGGTYLVEFNESVSLSEPAWLQPRDALLARGGTHPTLSVTDVERVPLTVPQGGLRIKENARVSTLVAPRG